MHRTYIHPLSHAKGGFSGGVAISEGGQVLGLITESLLAHGQPVELGYLAVITVEPIYVCLADHKLLPLTQAEGWDGLWNSTAIYFGARGTETSNGYGGLVVAHVELFDDGRSFSVTIACDDDEVFEQVLTAVLASIPNVDRREEIRPEISPNVVDGP
jgi:hypothetical protein